MFPSRRMLAKGVLQQVYLIDDGRAALIQDEIHGEYQINEGVLVALLSNPSVLRLKHVHQHGVTAMLGHIAPVTRYEHSVGAMLIVRRVGGSLEEQVFGLLHDVAHTVLSHTVDWALSKPGESYHEVQMNRYIEDTKLDDVLREFGLEYPRCVDEKNFGLVEQPSPHLCADRLDYGLRDAVAYGHLSKQDARNVLSHLGINLDSSFNSDRYLILTNAEVAKILAQSYLAMDRDIWANPVHVYTYFETAKIIKSLSEHQDFEDRWLWNMTDSEFWKRLHEYSSEDQEKTLKYLETTKAEDYCIKSMPSDTKIRTLDPDVATSGSHQVLPLSKLDPDYRKEKESYIDSQKSLMDIQPGCNEKNGVPT